MNSKSIKIIPALIWVLFFSVIADAQTVDTYDLRTFVIEGLQRDGYLSEKRFGKELKENALREIKMGAILPRFELSAGWGPAPGLKHSTDATTYTNGILDGNAFDSLTINEKTTEYDLTSLKNWGPALVTELKIIQPLNVFRYNSGLAAAKADKSVYNWDVKSFELKKTRELQEYYYGYVYAHEMYNLALEVHKEFGKIEEKLEELLDEDDPSVSQFDLLELKTNQYDIDAGIEESALGLKRAKLAAAFSLGYANIDSFVFQDSILQERVDMVPPLDTLKNTLKKNHPDLKKLYYGLKAKKALVQLAAGELGPEIFLFASADYAKSWAGDRRGISDEAFTEDPLNKVSGAIGVGIKYSLNIWLKKERYQKRKLEFTHLQRKESYAERGLLLLLEEQYEKYQKEKTLLKSARSALRAAEAWFKGAAMKYDVDKSESRGLLTAFRAKIKAKKQYVTSVYNFNLAIGLLYEKCGWPLLDNLETLALKEDRQ